MSDHLTADDVGAILDDEGSDTAFRHLAVCQQCRSHIQREKAADARLKALMFRAECPDSGMLAEFAVNRSLSATLAANLKQHLAICPYCREDLEDIQHMLGAALAPASAEPAPATPPLVERWRRSDRAKPAQQSYVSAQQELLVGESLAATLDTTSIFVSVERQPRSLFDLVGSVIDTDTERWINGSVEVYTDDQIYLSGSIDTLGSFEFANIPLKTLYIVVADSQGKRIGLPPWRFALE